MAPRAYPLHHDAPANFWFATTGVDLGATRHRQDIVILDFDRFIYSNQYPFAVYPDYPYQTITTEEAQTQLPAVAGELARRASANDPNDYVAKAYTQWIALDRYPPTALPSMNNLLLCIDQARSEFVAHSPPTPGFSKWPPPAHYANFQNGLLHVAAAARLFWATFTFELLFFSFLIWFTLWPYICRQSLRRKLTRVALFPAPALPAFLVQLLQPRHTIHHQRLFVRFRPHSRSPLPLHTMGYSYRPTFFNHG